MRLMNLSEIMDRSIDILRRNVKTIVLFSLGYGLITLIGIVAAIILGAILTGIVIAVSNNSIVLIILVVSIPVLFVIALVFSYYIGIIKISSSEFNSDKVFAHTAINTSFRSIFKVSVLVLIGFILFLPVIAAFGAIGYFLFKSFDTVNIVYGNFKGNEIGFLILFLIYTITAGFATLAFFTWFSFSFHALVLEKKNIFKSIKRSFYLVRRDYWRIFGSTLLFSLTVAALRISIDLLVSTGVSIIYLLLRLLNIKKDFLTFFSLIYSYLNWPLSILLLMIITPIGAIMLTMLYFNQRFKKEGFDLQLRLSYLEIKEERKQLSDTAQFDDSI